MKSICQRPHVIKGQTAFTTEDPADERFFAYIEAGKNGVSLLRVLMQQRGFSQSDLENEIGKKSLVSRILSGERSLTLDHMRALANRFQIPVSMFVD